MPEPTLHTTQMALLVDRLRAGDSAASDELLRSAADRLQRLASKMLRGFPNVGRWAEAEDVLQNASLRLLRTLREIRPASTRQFFQLAAVHLRRELIDLARHFDGPHGLNSRLTEAAPEALAQVPQAGEGADDLERFRRFHETVEGLPAAEREVVGLAYYHGWTQDQIAELFQVDVRTVRRRWDSALARLRAALGETVE